MIKKDINQLAKLIIDVAIGGSESSNNQHANPNKKGRPGGLLGGKARAKNLSSERRSEISKKAAEARWKR